MAFRSSASATGTGTGTITATPAGVQAHDYLGGWWLADGSATPTLTPPVGWTQRASVHVTLDGSTQFYADKNDATGSDAFGFADDAVGNNKALITAAWSGRNNSAPRSATPVTTGNSVSNTSPISATITGITAVNGDDIGIGLGSDEDTAGARWTESTIASYTQQVNGVAQDWVSGAGLQTRDGVSAGATGNFAVTITRTAGLGNSGYCGIVVAIAAAGSTTVNVGQSASLPTNRFVGPMVLRSRARRVVLDTTIAMQTDTATGPLPVIIPNPQVGPPALRPRAKWQTFWSTAPSSVLNNYVLSADSGVYTLTGAVAMILRAALLKANPGTYTITGQTAATLAGRLIKANSGVYNLTGQAATLLTTRFLNAGPGTYNLTGQTAKITATRVLSATAGVYNVTGNSASLLKGYLIKANPGSYTVTGASASTLTTRLLSAAAGIYTISGKAATLLYTPVGPTTSNLLLDTTNGHIIKQVTTHVYIDLNNGHLIWKVL